MLDILLSAIHIQIVKIIFVIAEPKIHHYNHNIPNVYIHI
jgi:hypothetical protein